MFTFLIFFFLFLIIIIIIIFMLFLWLHLRFRGNLALGFNLASFGNHFIHLIDLSKCLKSIFELHSFLWGIINLCSNCWEKTGVFSILLILNICKLFSQRSYSFVAYFDSIQDHFFRLIKNFFRYSFVSSYVVINVCIPIWVLIIIIIQLNWDIIIFKLIKSFLLVLLMLRLAILCFVLVILTFGPTL